MSDKELKKLEPKKTPAKPSIPSGLVFEFGEININFSSVKSGEHLGSLYKGKLARTDLPSAMKEFDRLRKKYQ